MRADTRKGAARGAHGIAAVSSCVALLALAGGCGVRSGEVLRARPIGGPDGGLPDAALPDASEGRDGGLAELPQTFMTTFFISPAGADTNPGTEDAPWKTFAHALPLLQPGATLVLVDGTYAVGTTGTLRAFCAPVMSTGMTPATVVVPMNALSGTPEQPITVRAQNERRAFLKGDGTGAPIELSACSNWVLEGLRAEGADVAAEMGDEPGSVVVLARACSNVVLRRLLASRPNRYKLASVYVLAHAAQGVLVEECEAVDYHYYGFHAFDSVHPIFRRDYAHSRDVADLAGGDATNPPTTGDGGFLLTKSRGGVIENCVAEHVADGFTVQGSSRSMGGLVQPHDDRVVGSLALDTTRAGFLVASHCNGAPRPCDQGDQLVSDPLFSDVVARGGQYGFWSTGGVRVTVENASIFDVTGTGVLFSIEPENMGLNSSADARASLVSATSTLGFRSAGYGDWTFSRCNAFGPTTSFSPRDQHVINGTEIDPQLGGCFVTVPDASPLKAAAGVGANIVFRLEDGQVTPIKLWDPTTGQFPCGATVAGINDRPEVSCTGAHVRAHVGTMGCPIP